MSRIITKDSFGEIKVHNNNLKYFLEYTESVYGIINNELREKLYKEYMIHKPVYDLVHNNCLLNFQIPRLLHTCTYHTRPDNEIWIKKVNAYCKINEMNQDLYPVVPKEILKGFSGYFSNLAPFMKFETPNEREQYWLTLENSFIRDFYSNWYNIIYDSKSCYQWINSYITAVNQVLDPDQSVQVTNIIHRLNERYQEKYKYLLANETSKSKKIPWWKKLFY